MKKQNNQNKLAFGKATVTELNDNQINQINGGSTDLISLIVVKATYGTWLMVV